jgi:hypothetical protein
MRSYKRSNTILSIIISAAPAIYLIVLPMLIAHTAHDASRPYVIFGGFLIAQLFIVTFDLAYQSAALVYSFDRKIVFNVGVQDDRLRTVLTQLRSPAKRLSDKIYPIYLMFISHIISVYAFAVMYIYLSSVDSGSFNIHQYLSVIDGIYFSTITAATIGYGDITPTSALARVVVIIQVYFSLFYTVLIFAGAASHLQKVAAAESPKHKSAASEGADRKNDV